MDFLTDPQVQGAFLAVLAACTVLCPLLEKAAAHTKNTTDDKLVHAFASAVGAISAFVPRLRLGK